MHYPSIFNWLSMPIQRDIHVHIQFIQHQRDGLCTGVHSVHTGVLMAKCALLTWGHRPECTLFLRVIGQSAHFF